MKAEIQKPVHVVLGPHGRKDKIQTLTPFKEKIEEMLQTTPQGKVVVMIESANVKDKVADRMYRFVKEGGIPSKAIFEYITLFRRKPTKGEVFLTSAVFKVPSFLESSFGGHEMKLMKNLAKQYPGRIDLLLESRISEGYVNRRQLIWPMMRYMSLGEKGKFTKGLPYYQKAVEMMAKNVAKRDPHNASRLDKVLQPEDVIGAVVNMGGIHTLLSHELHKKYNVTRTFTEKEQGKVIFLPFHDIIRKLVLTPHKQITPDQWMISYVKNLLSTNYSKQSNIIKVLNATKNLTIDDVKIFEDSVKQIGFAKASRQLLRELKMKKDN